MDTKKIFLSLTLLIGVIILIAGVQAKIVLSTPSEQYNLGDTIKQTITVITTENFNGFLRSSLVCSSNSSQNQSTLLYYSPIITEANKEKAFSFSVSPTSIGNCYILALLEKDNSKVEEAKTSNFIITNKINIEASLNKQFFMPEQSLKVTGKIIMANGKEFSGAVTILEENKNYSTVASKGSFTTTIDLEKTIAPGKHVLLIQANDDKNNFGSVNINFEVGTVETELKIDINNETINPGEILIITPSLLDQAGNIIPENISLKLVQLEDLSLAMQKRTDLVEAIVLSGNSLQYKFDLYANPQDYRIEAETSGFKLEKIISVSRVEKINYTIVMSNDTAKSTLIARNLGNVRYQKPLEIIFKIGDTEVTKVLSIDLEVNEEKSYSLNIIKGPEGLYEITLKSEGQINSFTDVPITGRISGFLNMSNTNSSLTWIIIPILIVALLAVILIAIRKNFFVNLFTPKKKKQSQKVYGFETYKEETQTSLPLTKKDNQKPISSFSSAKKQEKDRPAAMKMSHVVKKEINKTVERAAIQDSRTYSSRNDTLQDIFENNSGSLAASKIIPATIAGQKQEVTILNIKINGLNSLANIKNTDSFLFKELSNEYFSKIIKRISVNSGVASFYDNNFMILFNILPQANHTAQALKTAQEIKKITDEFNQELSMKKQLFQLNFAAGIHTGSLIITSIGSDKSIKYSPVQDTTNIAKSLERKAFKNEILLSEPAYNKVSSVIQAKKITPLALGNKAIPAYLVQETVAKKKDEPYWAK